MPAFSGLTYISLIPKIDNPKSISRFRPISLCNVCYKTITKILANKLKVDLPNLIRNEQFGFLQGRSLAENIFTLQEVVHTLDHDHRFPPMMIVKIEIEKE